MREEAAAPSQSVAMATPGREAGLAFLPYMLEREAPGRNSGWSPLSKKM